MAALDQTHPRRVGVVFIRSPNLKPTNVKKRKGKNFKESGVRTFAPDPSKI
jgi:hypothetical protein